jgi:predicted PurR-regulated permease PerM
MSHTIEGRRCAAGNRVAHYRCCVADEVPRSEPLVLSRPRPDGWVPLARQPVPVRLIVAIIGLILATIVALLLVVALRRILVYVVIAAFFAIILNPAVDLLERARLRRGLATLLVFLLGIVAFSSMIYAFVKPVYDASRRFADDIPGFVDRAQKGQGQVGKLVKRFKLDDYVRTHQGRLKDAVKNAGGPAAKAAGKLAQGVFGLVTILVLAFLLLLEGPHMVDGFLNALPPPRRERVRRVGRDAARAVTGYMFGNVLISIVAGTVTFVALAILRVPFAGVLGLWVGFADLLPLVGATVGAVPTVLIAFLHSSPAGIAMVVVFVVYQQFENHVLQTVVMSKTVKLNPLWVLLSVLIGVELSGIVGALLAIPAAGAIQVIARDIWDTRRGRIKDEPTIGESEIPISSPRASEATP